MGQAPIGSTTGRDRWLAHEHVGLRPSNTVDHEQDVFRSAGAVELTVDLTIELNVGGNQVLKLTTLCCSLTFFLRLELKRSLFIVCFCTMDVVRFAACSSSVILHFVSFGVLHYVALYFANLASCASRK